MPITWNDWTQWNHIPASPMIYEHDAIDLGAVLSFTPLVTFTGTGTPTITEKHSDDDITYSSYAPVGSLISARYFIIRVEVVETDVGGIIDSLLIIADASSITEDQFDVDTSTLSGTTGDRTVVPTKTFTLVTSIGVALQNVGAGWSWEVISKSPSGINIKIYDETDTLADANCDFTIRGIA
jgi:hypothetical protein